MKVVKKLEQLLEQPNSPFLFFKKLKEKGFELTLKYFIDGSLFENIIESIGIRNSLETLVETSSLDEIKSFLKQYIEFPPEFYDEFSEALEVTYYGDRHLGKYKRFFMEIGVHFMEEEKAVKIRASDEPSIKVYLYDIDKWEDALFDFLARYLCKRKEVVFPPRVEIHSELNYDFFGILYSRNPINGANEIIIQVHPGNFSERVIEISFPFTIWIDKNKRTINFIKGRFERIAFIKRKNSDTFSRELYLDIYPEKSSKEEIKLFGKNNILSKIVELYDCLENYFGDKDFYVVFYYKGGQIYVDRVDLLNIQSRSDFVDVNLSFTNEEFSGVVGEDITIDNFDPDSKKSILTVAPFFISNFVKKKIEEGYHWISIRRDKIKEIKGQRVKILPNGSYEKIMEEETPFPELLKNTFQQVSIPVSNSAEEEKVESVEKEITSVEEKKEKEKAYTIPNIIWPTARKIYVIGNLDVFDGLAKIEGKKCIIGEKEIPIVESADDIGKFNEIAINISTIPEEKLELILSFIEFLKSKRNRKIAIYVIMEKFDKNILSKINLDEVEGFIVKEEILPETTFYLFRNEIGKLLFRQG